MSAPDWPLARVRPYARHRGVLTNDDAVTVTELVCGLPATYRLAAGALAVRSRDPRLAALVAAEWLIDPFLRLACRRLGCGTLTLRAVILGADRPGLPRYGLAIGQHRPLVLDLHSPDLAGRPGSPLGWLDAPALTRALRDPTGAVLTTPPLLYQGAFDEALVATRALGASALHRATRRAGVVIRSYFETARLPDDARLLLALPQEAAVAGLGGAW